MTRYLFLSPFPPTYIHLLMPPKCTGTKSYIFIEALRYYVAKIDAIKDQLLISCKFYPLTNTMEMS